MRCTDCKPKPHADARSCPYWRLSSGFVPGNPSGLLRRLYRQCWAPRPSILRRIMKRESSSKLSAPKLLLRDNQLRAGMSVKQAAEALILNTQPLNSLGSCSLGVSGKFNLYFCGFLGKYGKGRQSQLLALAHRLQPKRFHDDHRRPGPARCQPFIGVWVFELI